MVVLKGAGKNFCAGLDLKAAMTRRAGQQEPPGITESLDSQRRIADIVMLMRLNMSVDAGSLEAVIAMEDRNQVLCSRSEEFSEGIRAFLEKRKPVYIKR